MRKQVAAATQMQADESGNWLDLDSLAQVEVSSEAPDFPIENALVPGAGNGKGWQAAGPGSATITLRFDTPQAIARILLHFSDSEHERSQEWSLSAVLADGATRDLLRQGWNFSPGGSSEQREQHAIHLASVSSLTLWIDPDRGRDRYPATLAAWRVGAEATA